MASGRHTVRPVRFTNVLVLGTENPPVIHTICRRTEFFSSPLRQENTQPEVGINSESLLLHACLLELFG